MSLKITNNICLKIPEFSSILCDFPWLFQIVQNSLTFFPDWKMPSYFSRFSSLSGNPVFVIHNVNHNVIHSVVNVIHKCLKKVVNCFKKVINHKFVILWMILMALSRTIPIPITWAKLREQLKTKIRYNLCFTATFFYDLTVLRLTDSHLRFIYTEQKQTWKRSDHYRCSIWTLNWIIYEAISKRCRFRFRPI